MNFGFSEEQEELRKMVKRFLEEKSPESEVRRLMATSEGYDSAVWDQMAKELALQGLGIPRSSVVRATVRSSSTWSLRRWARHSSARRTSRASPSPRTPCSSWVMTRTRRPICRHRLGRDHRHGGAH